MLPFTRDAFFEVFATYNQAIWPLQIVAYLLGIAVVAAVFVGIPARDRLVSALLATMWLWTGIAYHLVFFVPINPAAYLFGAFFIAQGMLFAAHGYSAD